MPVYLKANGGNIALKTSGIPQSQINELLEEQKERLDAEYGAQIDVLNTEIDTLEESNQALNTENDNLETQIVELNEVNTTLSTEISTLNTEINELQAIVDAMPIPVEGVEF